MSFLCPVILEYTLQNHKSGNAVDKIIFKQVTISHFFQITLNK